MSTPLQPLPYIGIPPFITLLGPSTFQQRYWQSTPPSKMKKTKKTTTTKPTRTQHTKKKERQQQELQNNEQNKKTSILSAWPLTIWAQYLVGMKSQTKRYHPFNRLGVR
jgi:hypothetical protein